MKNFKKLLMLISFIFLIGCTSKVETISEITAEDVLDLDPSANIFQYNDIIYQTDIDWVDELELSAGEKVMEIEAQSTDPDEFSHGVSNDLPVGTEIFEAVGRNDILIAVVDGDSINYMAVLEG